jgi:hypothetical protein
MAPISHRPEPRGGRADLGVPEPVIYFVCGALAHSKADPFASISPVRVHNGEWAYCPTGASLDHDWRQIEPVTRRELMVRELAGPAFPSAGL